MKNITFSADEHLIEKAREKAKKEQRPLNEAFREWLKSYTGSRTAVEEYRDLMKRFRYGDSGGRTFTRDERNER